jgi:hypothetical protein
MLDATGSNKKADLAPDTHSTNTDWVTRAVNGFADAGKEAIQNPGETALKVAAGLAAGGALQAAINNVEHCGGKIGTVAKVGKVALLAVPLGLAGFEIATADDSARTAGKMAFETGLFLGAAKLGRSADQITGLGKAFGPRPMSELPATPAGERLSYQVFGDKVHVSFPKHHDVPLPAQVRLGNGKGFVVNNRHQVSDLMAMPTELKGIGKLEYGKHSTELHTESGVFKRELSMGRTSTAGTDGSKVSTFNGKDVEVVRKNGDEVYFGRDGHVSVQQGKFESGRSWEFKPTGEVDMRSLPAGKYRLHADANGDATYTYTHGSSRSIRGMVASSRYKPLQQDVTPVEYNRAAGTIGHYQIPDIRPVDKHVLANLFSARSAFDSIYKAS